MIHKYKLAGYNIVLDVNSGMVYKVDDLTYDILDNVRPPFEEKCPENVRKKLMKFYSQEDIDSCYEEVCQLYSEKIFFSEERQSENTCSGILRSLCLNISHDCNLRCEYCFASSGQFGGKRMLMDESTAVKAVDWLLERSGEQQDLEINFFGGEPLMNLSVIRKTIDYARSKEKESGKTFKFTMTTNGTLLDDKTIDYINENMDSVVLSVDGRKQTNDRIRKYPDGKGCYDKITGQYKKLTEAENACSYYLRGTYTRYNTDFSEDAFSLFDSGFDCVSIEPVTGNVSEEYAISEADLPKIFREYEKLAERIVSEKKNGRDLKFFHFDFDLDRDPAECTRGCGCANEYIAVTPEGDIYPCHRFVGIDNFRMGNIHDGSFDTDMSSMFMRSDIRTKTECSRCWARYYCGGGCNALNYISNGDILASHKFSCQIMKKRIECAIMIKAAADE